MKRIFITLCTALPMLYVFGQSPGGVAAPDFWVKSDDAGNIATAWKDHSTNANDIPSVGTWTLSPADRAHNFHPYTTGYTASKYFYNNNNSALHSNTGVGVEANHSIFSVVRPTSATIQGRIIGIDDDTNAAEPGVSITNTGLPNHYEFSRTTTDTDFTTPFTTGGINIFSAITNNTSGIGGGTSSSAGGEKRLGLNGIYQTTTFTGALAGNRFQLAGRRLRIGQSGWTHGGAFPGDIMEIVWYNRLLTPNEQSRINSYLALKNGATLGEDYLTASSAVIWSRTINTGYNNNIFGIARDDASALHQKQASSTNPNQKLIIGNGTTLFNTNALNTNSLTTGQSLIVGDNGLKQGLSIPFVYTAGTNGSTNYRFESIWKVQNTNGVGQVTVAWPKGIANMYVLQSSDPTFATVSAYIPMTTEVTINGVVYNTATVNLANGAFFTFAGFEYSPGGVTSAAWYRADAVNNLFSDAGTTIVSDASTIQQWNEFNNKPFPLSQSTASIRPAFSNATTLVNFNPTVTYTGGEKWLQYNPADSNGNMIDRSNGALFTAGSTTSLAPFIGFGVSGSGNAMDDPGLYSFTSNKFLFYPIITEYDAQSTYSIDGPFIGGGTWQNGAGAGGNNSVDITLNGYHQTYNTNITNVNLATDRNSFIVGKADAGYQLDGQQNEMIVFDNRLTDQEINRIESYLAIKYGNTLSKEQNRNYLSSTGTVIWDGSGNNTYYNNIIGIGREDLSALYQKQSKSINPSQKLILGAGSSLFNTNAANTNTLTDAQYLIVGDNGLKQTLSTSLAYTAGLNGPVNFRFESIWKVQNTNNVGQVTIAWPKGIQNLYLVQSVNETFDSSDTFTPMSTEVTVNGVVYNTTTVTLGDGQFFTFAGFGHAPAGVVNSLSYWYRADKDATNTGVGTDVTNWTDYFAGTVSSQISTAPLPKYVEGSANYFNYNPGINFTTTTQLIGNISVSSLSALNFDIFTFTKEGMTGTRYFNVGRNNTSFTADNWDSPGLYANGNIASRNNAGGGTVIVNPGGIAFSTTIPSIMYHTFTDTNMSKGLNGNLNGMPSNYSTRGQITGGHIFGSNDEPTPPGGDDPGFIGHIGETIIYGAGSLSAQERRRVDSYMAIKYGITLGRVATDHYLGSTASPTSIVWSGTLNTTYNNNIFGIARADVGGFQQKVSKSVNTGTILTIAKDNDFVSSNLAASRTTALPTDESYMILGDNNVTSTTLVDLSLGANNLKRIQRIWLSQRTNTLGSIYLESDLSAYGSLFTPGNTVYMLVADDAGFTSNVAQVVGTNTTGKWVFNYNFDSSAAARYITFAQGLDCSGPDSDGDGIPDPCDLDDDNDGILDTDECPTITYLVRPVVTSSITANKPITSGTAQELVNGEGAGGTGAGPSPTTHWYTLTSNLPIAFTMNLQAASTIDHIKLYSPWGNDEWIGNFRVELYNSSNVLLGTENLTAPNQYTGTPILSFSQEYSNVTRIRFTVLTTQGYSPLLRVSVIEIVFLDLQPLACDTDNDGTPNHLDLDSDDDGCPDAIEGGDNVTTSQLNPNGSINTAANGGLNANGVPNLVNSGGAADISSDQGQGIGFSQSALFNECDSTSGFDCIKPGVAGTPLPTKVGILTKSNPSTQWPQNVPNGHIVLDGAEKGFVITHMTTAQRDALLPVEGMMIYNTTVNCVQLYRGTTPSVDSGRTGWNCLETACDGLPQRNVNVGYWGTSGFNFFSGHPVFRSQLQNTSNYGSTGTFKGVSGWTWIDANTDINATAATFTAAQMKAKYDMIVTGYNNMTAASAAKIKEYTDLGGVVFVLADGLQSAGNPLNTAFGGTGNISNGSDAQAGTNAQARTLNNAISNGIFGIGGGATIIGVAGQAVPPVANIPAGSFITAYMNFPSATSTTNAGVYITGASGRAIFVYDEGIYRNASVAGTVINTPQEIFIHNLMSYALQKIGFSAQ